MRYEADVIIVGAGLVGLACACALAQETPFSILLLNSKTHNTSWRQDEYDHRVSAISFTTKNILSSIGAWQTIKKARISPFKAIEIYEPDNKAHVSFDSKEINATELGYIVENNLLLQTLFDRMQSLPQIKFHENIHLQQLIQHEDSIELISEDDSYFAKLAVGADGAHSWLRTQAKIETIIKDYNQRAIVTNVKTEKPHKEIARQLFSASGPLAFLPLQDPHTSSIVWSLPIETALAYAELNAVEFAQQLQQQFSFLGSIIDVSPRFTFPLTKLIAKKYIAERIALIGDAAHVVHPMAGQGANIGLLDMAALVEIIQQHAHNFSTFRVLRKYERWRKADNLSMIKSIDLLKYLFDNQSINSLRQLGLKFTAQSNTLKKFFMQQAVGNRADLPKLAHLSS